MRGAPEVREILDFRFRPLAVRPSDGARERPILASVSHEPTEAPASGSPGGIG